MLLHVLDTDLCDAVVWLTGQGACWLATNGGVGALAVAACRKGLR